jgi:hypothetical protein
MATNGVQWLRNIRNGIATSTEALQEMETNLRRIQALRGAGETTLRQSLPRSGQGSISHWDEDPEYKVRDWRAEVANDDTRLGYLEWATHQRELAGQEPPPVRP